MSIFTHLEYIAVLANNATAESDSGHFTDIDVLKKYTDNEVDTVIFGGPIRCYSKFQITPRDVTYGDEEHTFRIACLKEELRELNDAINENDIHETIDALVDLLIFAIGTSYRTGNVFRSMFAYKNHASSVGYLIHQRIKHNDESPLQAVHQVAESFVNELQHYDHRHYLKYQNKIDQIIATVLTFLLNEYDREMILEYYERVTQANLSKELGSLPKRGSFSIDLKKPEGWKAPTFEGLLN